MDLSSSGKQSRYARLALRGLANAECNRGTAVCLSLVRNCGTLYKRWCSLELDCAPSVPAMPSPSWRPTSPLAARAAAPADRAARRLADRQVRTTGEAKVRGVRGNLQPMARAYHRRHRFACPTCISAGKGYGLRCGVGASLWVGYSETPPAPGAAPHQKGDHHD